MAAAAGNSKASLATAASDDEHSTIKVATREKKDADKEKPAGTIKLKKPAPKIKLPGNWRDGSVVDDDKKKDKADTSSSSISPGPVVNQLDDKARETFATGRPLEDVPDPRQCKHCKKSLLKTAMKPHVIACLKAKKEKLQRKKEAKEAREREKKAVVGREEEKEEEGDTKMDDSADDDDASPEKKAAGGIKSAKKSAGKKLDFDEKKGKKRKAEGDAEKGPKQKKKKEEPKVKATKQKGPVDVERQCGVLKDGVACARSLTCKSHSMGAKRAVPGRSLPYDMLLTAYQKKNQAKQQKAAIDANAPLEDEDAGQGPIDSDEELTLVMAGLSNWNPQPVVPPLVHVMIEKRYQKERLYEQMFQATNGFTRDIFAVVGLGAQKMQGVGERDVEMGGTAGSGMGSVDEGRAVVEKRVSGFNMVLPLQRRPSGGVARA